MFSKDSLMIPSPNIYGTFALCPGLSVGVNIIVSVFSFLLSHGATLPGARYCGEGIYHIIYFYLILILTVRQIL